MATLKQSTSYVRTFLMVDSSNHVSGKTGLAPVVTLSKAGAAFATAGGAVAELSNGWYKITLTTTDTNTLGDLDFHCTDTGADPTDFQDQVTSNILGDTLPVNVTQFGSAAGTFSGGRPEVNLSHIAGATVATSSAQLGVNVVNWKGTGAAATDTAGYPVVTIKDGTGQGEIATTSGAIDTVTTLTNAPLDSAGIATLLARLTSTRAGYLDNLSPGLVSTLDAAGVRSAVGLASANLDTQLDALPTADENADAQLDNIITGHTTNNSVGQLYSNIYANTVTTELFTEKLDGLGIAYGSPDGVCTTTTLHLDLAYADDEINDYLIVIRNNSVSPLRYYTRWISDWNSTTKIATLNSALPWTPTAFFDTFWIFAIQGSLPGSVGTVNSVATGGIASTSFAAGAIDSAAIAANAIGASEIADSAITSTKLASGAIVSGTWATTGIDRIMDEPIGDGSITLRQAMRVMIAALAGRLSGAATTSITIRNVANSADVIVATVDANGNRTSTTVTP